MSQLVENILSMNESIAFSWTLMEREKQIVLRATRLMRVWGVSGSLIKQS
jgi:hypothetical protein